jgi:hypothetical protein
VSVFGRAPDIEAADKALAESEAILARWVAEVESKGAELAHLQAHAGDDVLADADAADRIAGQTVALAAGADVARRAVLAASARVDEARRVVLRARAALLRTRVGKLRRTVESRQKRTDGLLAALTEHEGAAFHVWTPDCQYGHLSASVQSGAISYKVPLTGVIAGRADFLERQAVDLEQLAESGAAEQVAAAVGQPLAEPIDLDREFAGVR